MKKLAIFDVDYTLTSSETMVELLKFYLKKYPFRFYYAFNSLRGFLGFASGLTDEKKSKEVHLKFLEKFTADELEKFIEDYYNNQLKKILLKDGFKKLSELKTQGYTVILSSASPEIYLHKLYEYKDIDKIFGSKFGRYEDGRFKSVMIGNNNKGQEKIERLKEYINLDEVDLKNSVMFSDSLSDLPLLNLCGKGYLINYTKIQNRFEVLNWK